MAHFVDEPAELFHSMAWAMSIKACSGEYARNHDGTFIVLPSDAVYYRCIISGYDYSGLVIWVGVLGTKLSTARWPFYDNDF